MEEIPERVQSSGDCNDDDHVSVASSCGSLSFVITDDLDAIDAAAGPMSSASRLESFMTRSQYARVVFHDIADRYPNNRDLLVMYTMCGDMEEQVDYDRIGLFRVPSFAAHEHLAMKWVSTSAANSSSGGAANKIVDDKKKIFSIVFESNELPKDEDFYQFQYLRNNEVFGASVPFQLRGGEELCTTEADEFERVDRESDVAHRSLIEKISSLTAENEDLKTKFDESETKCHDLKTKLEDLEFETKRKNDSFLVLDEKFKSFQDDSSKSLEQLRTDFACALQDKLVLEERLHKGQKTIILLQTDRDMQHGRVSQLTREKRLVEEELVLLNRRLEEDRNMFQATIKAKELAVNEIKAYIIRNDEVQKVVDRLRRELDASNAQCESLQLVLDSLKVKFEEAERAKEAGDREKDLLVAELEARLENLVGAKDAEIERLTRSLTLKQKEFEVLSAELVNRSKNKFQQIDQLKKQLSETERSLNKCLNGPASLTSLDASSVLESLSQIEIDDDDTENRMKNLESRILALHSEFKKVEQSHAEEIRGIKDELESLRSTTMSHSFASSMSSNDSRRMMDSRLINTAASVLRSQMSLTESASQTELKIEPEPESQVPSAPFAGTADCTTAPPPIPPRGPLPQCLEPITTEESESAGVLGKILPRLGATFFANRQAGGGAEGGLPDPLVPQKAASPPSPNSPTETSIEDDFTALAEWAKGCLMPRRKIEQSEHLSMETVTESNPPSGPTSQVQLTDDGRTVEAPTDVMLCPFCQREYQSTEVERLQAHVESHMDGQLTCPVCEKVYEVQDDDRREYQSHVQSHFPNDTDEISMTGTRVQEQQQQPRDSFWFLDFD